MSSWRTKTCLVKWVFSPTSPFLFLMNLPAKYTPMICFKLYNWLLRYNLPPHQLRSPTCPPPLQQSVL